VGSNWTNGSVPANDTTSDNARFTSVPSNMPSLTSDRSIYGMDFTVGGVTVNGNYDLTLGNDGIDSSGSGTNVVNLNPIITGTWANWQIDSGNTLTVNGNLNGTSTELVLGSSSGGTINLNGSSNSYNSKLNLRGNNHNRITANVTGALNNLVHLKVGDKNNTTDNGKATLNLIGSNASVETSDKLFVRMGDTLRLGFDQKIVQQKLDYINAKKNNEDISSKDYDSIKIKKDTKVIHIDKNSGD
jgi:hypothetical protein